MEGSNSDRKKYAVIVAGGKGVRMGADTPKQFLLLAGKPVLMHSIEAFAHVGGEVVIVLVLPPSQLAVWGELVVGHGFDLPHTVVAGGDTRFHSVRNGLAIVPEGALVAVHDGVRPLVSRHTISQSFEIAAAFGSAVAASVLKDSIRELDEQGLGSQARLRARYMTVQTPQAFRSEWIKAAYAAGYQDWFTDCASVLENAKIGEVKLFEGNEGNIKITTPTDLVIAEALISK